MRNKVTSYLPPFSALRPVSGPQPECYWLPLLCFSWTYSARRLPWWLNNEMQLRFMTKKMSTRYIWLRNEMMIFWTNCVDELTIIPFRGVFMYFISRLFISFLYASYPPGWANSPDWILCDTDAYKESMSCKHAWTDASSFCLQIVSYSRITWSLIKFKQK